MMHTKTPWKAFQKYKDGTKTSIGAAVGNNNDCVAFLAECLAEPDAAFIVHAVNNHDRLVKALNDLGEYAQGFNVSGVYFDDEYDARILLDQAYEALAKAGVEP
jgi:hypothetical protein